MGLNPSSLVLLVTEQLSEYQTNHLDAANAFHPHNQRVRDIYFGGNSLCDL
jgi:hypothetical protein